VESKLNNLSSEVWRQASAQDDAIRATRDYAEKQIREAVEDVRTEVRKLVGQDVGWEIRADVATIADGVDPRLTEQVAELANTVEEPRPAVGQAARQQVGGPSWTPCIGAAHGFQGRRPAQSTSHDAAVDVMVGLTGAGGHTSCWGALLCCCGTWQVVG
jgi:hypothetical protein